MLRFNSSIVCGPKPLRSVLSLSAPTPLLPASALSVFTLSIFTLAPLRLRSPS